MPHSSVNDCAYKILLSLNLTFGLFQLNMLYCVLFWTTVEWTYMWFHGPVGECISDTVPVIYVIIIRNLCIPGSSLKSSVSMTNSIPSFGVIWMGFMTCSAILTVDFLYSRHRNAPYEVIFYCNHFRVTAGIIRQFNTNYFTFLERLNKPIILCEWSATR